MKTIHYSANSVMPNTTGLVGIQVLDIDEEKPTVSLVPILGWAMADGIEPQPIYLWSTAKHIDAVYDPRTGHVMDDCLGIWSSLDEAVEHFASMHRLKRVLDQDSSKQQKPKKRAA